MASPSNPNNIPQSAAASLNNTATSSNNNNTNHSSGANQNQEVLEATKLKFAEEKSLLKTHPLPKTVFKDHLKGLHWEAVMHIHWAAVHSLRLSMHDQFFSEYHGMLQVFSVLDQATEEDRYQDYTSIARMLVVCPICFNNPSVSLYKSLTILSWHPRSIPSSQQLDYFYFFGNFFSIGTPPHCITTTMVCSGCCISITLLLISILLYFNDAGTAFVGEASRRSRSV
ncbi:hypothetical protein ACA910_019645 [Epithemia clementina (nom. ined.)]